MSLGGGVAVLLYRQMSQRVNACAHPLYYQSPLVTACIGQYLHRALFALTSASAGHFLYWLMRPLVTACIDQCLHWSLTVLASVSEGH